MRLVSSGNPQHRASLLEAILRPLAPDGGSYHPDPIACFRDVRTLLRLGFLPRCVEILHRCLGDEVDRNSLEGLVEKSLDFPIRLNALRERIFVLELFHGPSACAQEAGARLLAGLMGHCQPRLRTLLAVGLENALAAGQAFRSTKGLRVVALVPQCEGAVPAFGIGENFQAFSMAGTRKEAETLVRGCLEDAGLCEAHGLTCLGSLNPALLLANVLLWFEGMAQLLVHWGDAPVLGIASEPQGFLKAALLAQSMGLPVRAIATDSEEGIPRNLLRPGRLEPGELRRAQWELNACGYPPEPMTAEAFGLLQGRMGLAEMGLILAPRHPGFARVELQQALNLTVPQPPGWDGGRMEMRPLEASAEALRKVL
ncbi:hypothetical protein [Holophaga foetida]|uniref:hypothetical protein n=1 Tax=Holophaga foetida TaxID=35839 RepID=UPI000247263E|nr:hypothetical protein [Holophaga foetida]